MNTKFDISVTQPSILTPVDRVLLTD